MAEQEVRLGGMALANGVLVHGPTAWACAVRLPDGRLEVAAELKRYRASSVTNPLFRGPARLAEVITLLPRVRRRMPAAKLPFERPRVLTAMVAGAAAVQLARGSRLTPAAQELVGAIASLVPAAIALRSSDLAAYHGAEHIAIGTHEHGEAREKEHERCGSHLLGPLLATLAVGNTLAARAPIHLRAPARALASLGALAVSTEIFSWMVRHPDNPVAKALARPGHEIQHRLATAEPTPEQLEVAEAALAACLELEHGSQD
ncbi:MAG: DUF1385 domain-containing protein [Gaiellaceae bacterium]